MTIQMITMKLRVVACAALFTLVSPAFALNILIGNDDGLTSNIKALYDALKAEGHDVIVSVPCTNQSGRSAAIVMYSTTTIVADNDSQIGTAGCRNGVAAVGAPAVGAFAKTGYTNGDFYYVHGTPVMATMYGLDQQAQVRWSKAPDLVLSGPNEGQNVGGVVVNSGTIGNVQLSAGRGIPSIALSAGFGTVDNATLAAPDSAVVAQLTIKLIKALQAKAGTGPLLPAGLALNVNFPSTIAADTAFAFSRIGTFNLYDFKFNSAAPWGSGVAFNSISSATAAQAEDETVVMQNKISVTAMQVAFDQRTSGQQWLRLRLRDLLTK